MFGNMAQLSGELFETVLNINKTLCRLCGGTTNPNQRFLIFSQCGKSVKLQRLISELAKVRVKEDDCLPKHLYRTVINLRDKLTSFQAKCASTQINLSKEERK